MTRVHVPPFVGRIVVFGAMCALWWPAAPASAARPKPFLPQDPRLNLQAPNMTVEVPLQIDGGVPDSWEIAVVYPASLGGGSVIPTPEMEIAHGSGTGVVQKAILPVADPEWRWRFMNTTIYPVYVRMRWTSGPDSGTYDLALPTGRLPDLTMTTDRGLDNGGFSYEPGFPIYRGLGYIDVPQDPVYEAQGKLIHDATGPRTFAAKGHMRGVATVPYIVSPRLASKIQVVIEYVPTNDPRSSVAVFRGRANVSAATQAGSQVRVPAKLTRRGKRRAAALGARRLAAALANHGRVFFTTRLRKGTDNTLERVEVPTGTCFPQDEFGKKYPCAQTCPKFPNMPSGYVIYSAIGEVFGSYTCTRGAPLVPWPSS